jgi:hypothetical protein
LPPDARRVGQIGRGVSLAVPVAHPFGVCRPRRAIRGLPTSRTIPLRRLVRVTTPKPCPASPLRFSRLASRVCCVDRVESIGRCAARLSRRGGDAARAGHSCLVFFGQRTFRARARAVLAAWPAALSRPRRRPWGLPGPFAVLPRPSGERASSACSGPPAVSPGGSPREFHRRGSAF